MQQTEPQTNPNTTAPTSNHHGARCSLLHYVYDMLALSSSSSSAPRTTQERVDNIEPQKSRFIMHSLPSTDLKHTVTTIKTFLAFFCLDMFFLLYLR